MLDLSKNQELYPFRLVKYIMYFEFTVKFRYLEVVSMDTWIYISCLHKVVLGYLCYVCHTDISINLHHYFCPTPIIFCYFGVMVSNATFNNIAIISWRSVFLVEETGVTQILSRRSRGHDRIVVIFTSTHPISAYHNVSCDFEPVHDEVYSIQLYHYFCPTPIIFCYFGVMVSNATFNNVSVISWRSVLLVEKTGVPGENHRYHIMLYRLYHS
jgi:hypothetical protein